MGFKYEETIFDPRLDRFITKEEFLEFKKTEPGRILIAYSPPRRDWLPEWGKLEHFVVASDGMPGLDANGNLLDWTAPYKEYAGHPRSAGTHAIVLRLARENDVSLMQAIAQLSYWSAKHIGDAGVTGLQVRGRMQEGMVADITIFDPDTVTEHATFEMGTSGLASTGIPFVLVNGIIVVKNSRVLESVFPGQSIRFPVEEKGRFEPIEESSWKNAYDVKK